ncbi:hypothetical protein HDU87_002479 [Geranomyces variabilis]|uniref:Uncharacterized protein n=1 Tax=Geranomyces variabilis TaxID=109894 RepID=A0AAD5TL72_9FUNG|nr:hypothetical protein HDU87_002479 [Geranomyces variabilis]
MITDCNVCHEPRWEALDEPLYKSCALVMGIAWVTCYAAMAVTNYKDKSFVVTEVYWASVLWVLFDLVLFYQTWLYARNEFTAYPFLRQHTTLLLAAGVIAGFPGILFFLEYAHDVRLGLLAGLVLNTALAVSYVAMLVNRGSSRGQSMVIAVTKGVGSAAAWVLNIGLGYDHKFLLYLYVLNVATDVVYAVGLYKVIRRETTPIKLQYENFK